MAYLMNSLSESHMIKIINNPSIAFISRSFKHDSDFCHIWNKWWTVRIITEQYKNENTKSAPNELEIQA